MNDVNSRLVKHTEQAWHEFDIDQQVSRPFAEFDFGMGPFGSITIDNLKKLDGIMASCGCVQFVTRAWP